ncbi:MAG: hypothetical protein QXP91_03890 [Candidatus Methanomethylicia archaeon]
MGLNQLYDVIWRAVRNENYFKNIVDYILSSGIGRGKVLNLTGQWSSFSEKPIYLRFSILVKLICLVIVENMKLVEELNEFDSALKLLEKLREDLIMEVNEYKVRNSLINETLNIIEGVIDKLKMLRKAKSTF